jgi:hypothetical protein
MLDHIPHLPHNPFTPKKKSRSRVIAWVIGIVLTLLIATLIVIGPLVYQGVKTIHTALAISDHLDRLVDFGRANKWQEAEAELATIRLKSLDAKNNLHHLGLISYIPVVRENVEVIDRLVTVGADIAFGYESALSVLAEFDAQLRAEHVVIGFSNGQERRSLLSAIASKQSELEETALRLEQARKDLANINTNELTGPLQAQLMKAHSILSQVLDNTQTALPIFRHLPELLGYDREKTYLIVFQNNTELRPTGGFIGSYGLLSVKDGEITKMTTDDIYNLDKLSEGKMQELAPPPMAKYNNQKYWYLRDANWSPHWPTSAQQIVWFWDQERQHAQLPPQPLDGVIAITPEFISNLLLVTGPLMVEDVLFNPENFTQTLEQFVEFDYADRGIHHTQRKAIISPLTILLIERINKLPPEDLLRVWLAFKQNMDEKNILAYFPDAQLQSYFENQNWSGVVKSTEGDYLMLIDSNLAALKTDQVMKRAIDYRVRVDDNGDLIARTAITYHHDGKPVKDLVTRYRTYARLYIPRGSWLLSAYIDDDTGRQDLEILKDVEIMDDLSKRVAATFLVIEPTKRRTLVMEYRLPKNIREQYEQGRYSLLTQKQPGTIGHDLKIGLDLNQLIHAYQSPVLPQLFGGDAISWTTNLAVDREFRVNTGR